MLAQSCYTKKSDIKGNRRACLWYLNQTRDIKCFLYSGYIQ